jgi:signal transduction histidine kinase
VISVRDYGFGVPDEFLTTIFEPFVRVEGDRSRSSGGVGLGLSIARRAIDLHHGKIEARNAGPGLDVVIELPHIPAHAYLGSA